MAMKVYSTFLKATVWPQIVNCHTLNIYWGVLIPLQRCSRCILRPQPTGCGVKKENKTSMDYCNCSRWWANHHFHLPLFHSDYVIRILNSSEFNIANNNKYKNNFCAEIAFVQCLFRGLRFSTRFSSLHNWLFLSSHEFDSVSITFNETNRLISFEIGGHFYVLLSSLLTALYTFLEMKK